MRDANSINCSSLPGVPISETPTGHPLTVKTGMETCGKPPSPAIHVRAMVLDRNEVRVVASEFKSGATHGAVGITRAEPGIIS